MFYILSSVYSNSRVLWVSKHSVGEMTLNYKSNMAYLSKPEEWMVEPQTTKN